MVADDEEGRPGQELEADEPVVVGAVEDDRGDEGSGPRRRSPHPELDLLTAIFGRPVRVAA